MTSLDIIGSARFESEDSVAGPREPSYVWTGEFADPADEGEFREATWGEQIERAHSVQIAVLFFAAWAGVDYFAIGMSWTFLAVLILRLLTIPLARIPTVYFSQPRSHKAFFASITFAQAYVFAVFIFAFSVGRTPSMEQAFSAFAIIFGFYFGVPNRLSLNIFVSLGSTVAFAATMALSSGVSLRSAGLAFLLLLVGNVCGIQAIRLSNRLRRSQFLIMRAQKDLNDQLTVEIATRQEAERAVLATEENFHSIFVAAPEALAILDPSTHRVVRANRKALDLFGEGEELEGIDARGLFVDQEVRNRIAEEAIGRRPRHPIEAQLTTAKGEIIWARISAAMVRFHGLPAMLVALQDVTERRHEAEALREARDQATASSRSKSEFLANMSHELRTPLNAIIGFSEALERELFGPVGNPRYLEYAGDIHDSGVHLLNLINDILDLSKIEAGHFKLHEDETDLDGIVASACRIVRHRAQQASISIETHLPKPGISLNADERAMKQILINLVSNAIKFSDDCGTVRIEGHVNADGLRLAVRDTGIGIAAEDIPKALSPFTQLDGTLSRAHEGTGLGLPLAKYMTELHGGTLSIDSEPGVGTTVFIDIPASRLVDHGASLTAVS